MPNGSIPGHARSADARNEGAPAVSPQSGALGPCRTFECREFRMAASLVGRGEPTMNVDPTPVWAALDDFSDVLRQMGAAPAVLKLRTRLAAERSAHRPESWQAWCSESARHPAFS